MMRLEDIRKKLVTQQIQASELLSSINGLIAIIDAELDLRSIRTQQFKIIDKTTQLNEVIK